MRLKSWDYTRPFYYLVTLKRLPNLPPLSRLDENDAWGLDPNYSLMAALSEEINAFEARSPGVASVKPFRIMPDHIHLLIKLKEIPECKTLQYYVSVLKGFLRRRFKKETGIETTLFETEWHDLICKKQRQLNNFSHYILNNPQMALLRRSARGWFHCYRNQKHYRLEGLLFDLVGNPELLDEPGLIAVKISRKVTEGSPEWAETMSFFDRWKPGITAVGTWWSKGEQAAYQKILQKGGFIIRLDPHGFPERWHPAGDAAQQAVAEGKVLNLSPYPPHTAKLPEGTLRRRCLELNDLALKMQEATCRS